MLQSLLGFGYRFGGLDLVQMCKNTHHFGESMSFENVQELKSFHLKSKARIDHEEHQVSDLRDIAHRVEIIGTFKKGDPPFFTSHYGDRAATPFDILLRIVSDQRSDERGFTTAFGANNCNLESDQTTDLEGESTDERSLRKASLPKKVDSPLTYHIRRWI